MLYDLTTIIVPAATTLLQHCISVLDVSQHRPRLIPCHPKPSTLSLSRQRKDPTLHTRHQSRFHLLPQPCCLALHVPLVDSRPPKPHSRLNRLVVRIIDSALAHDASDLCHVLSQLRCPVVRLPRTPLMRKHVINEKTAYLWNRLRLAREDSQDWD